MLNSIINLHDTYNEIQNIFKIEITLIITNLYIILHIKKLMDYSFATNDFLWKLKKFECFYYNNFIWSFK